MSVPNAILAIVKTRLEVLTPGNVYRPDIGGGFPTDDGVHVITHEDAEVNEELSAPGNPPLIAYDLPIVIGIVINPSKASSTALDSLKDAVVVAASDAIATPAATWHQFDGNAINANFGPPQNVDPGDDGHHGIKFTVVVTYRVRETSQATAV